MWTLGDRLRRALDHGNVRVKDMQAELGVSHGTMTNYLNNTTKPNRSTLKVWALRCGVSFEWLVNGVDDSTVSPSTYRTNVIPPFVVEALGQVA